MPPVCACGSPCRKKGNTASGLPRYDYRCQKCHRQHHGHQISRPERERKRGYKKIAIRHYGGHCSCCGEAETAFLTVSSKEAVMLKLPPKTTIYHWLYLNDFPADFQVWCWNCNTGRNSNGGICPHLYKNRRKTFMAGMTLAELVSKKLKDKFGKPLETGKFSDKNPLEARIGGVITIDSGDTDGLFFTVKEIAGATEQIGSTTVTFTDYALVATPGGDDERADDSGKIRRVLRVLPVEEKDKYLQYNCVLLAQFYECDYQQAVVDNLHNLEFQPGGNRPWPVLQDPNGEFNDFETGDVYSRRFRGYAGWEQPHIVRYTVLRDLDGDGRVDENEVEERRKSQFWDYEREVPVGTNGRSSTEFLYVEQDADGYFRLYKGRQVPQEMITRL